MPVCLSVVSTFLSRALDSCSLFVSFQLVQVFQPCQYDLLTRLFDLSGQKDLVEDGIDLVEVEDEIQLADIAKELVQHLDEEVDGLEIREFVVIGVDADAEEQARVAPVDDLGRRQVLADQRLGVRGRGGRTGRGSELDEVGLVFLVARRNESVDLVETRECQYACDNTFSVMSRFLTSPFNLTFSSSV